MKRELQGQYITISTVGEKAQAFIPAPLPPIPSLEWMPDLRSKFDQALFALGRAGASTLRIHQALMGRPITSSGWLVKKTGITPATVNKCLEHLERLGIIQELTLRKRNRVFFSYTEHLEIMNQGTELPG